MASDQIKGPEKKEKGFRSFFSSSEGPDLEADVSEKPHRAEPTLRGHSFETSDKYLDLKVRLHQEVIQNINLSALDKMTHDDVQLEISGLVRSMLESEKVPMNATERNKLIGEVVDELLGLGPIEPLLKDPTVNDILVNTYQQVFVERSGMLELTDVQFKDEAHLLRIIDKIVSNAGRRIDESNPKVDARLPDGSRVNAVIPPVGVDGSLLSIRKFAKIPIDIKKMIEIGSLTEENARILEGIVQARLNVLISGGTGTGKTTLLNALSSFIGNHERIITIEDAAELQLQQTHVARMETRPPNIEGKGEITQRDLVVNSLRMRPDRIIVGEVRSGEAFDMLQAMNTGHDGSLTTVHANTPRDALGRIEQMIGMSGLDLPTRSMRAQIASAIQVVLQIRRFSDGTRKLVSIQELTGMEGEVITMQEIFRFEQTGVDADGKVMGEFVATGLRPHFYDKFHAMGIPVPEDILGGRKRR
ncbi:MAG: CpaF family protein [Alphaproteobacteria bacterium]|nr:MAG: CpaF family protein [Alphaproteobacteria bacterium]